MNDDMKEPRGYVNPKPNMNIVIPRIIAPLTNFCVAIDYIMIKVI